MPDMPQDFDRSRGRYVHRVDGAPAGVEERFAAGEVGSGIRLRSIRVAARPASRLETDLRLAPGATTAVVRWTGSGEGVVREALLECTWLSGTWLDGTVELRRTVDGVVGDPSLVEGRLLLPGLVLAGLAGAGPAYGVMPGDPYDADSVLVAQPVDLRVEDAGTALVAVAGHEVEGQRVLRSFAGTDLPVVEDVVDEGGLLLRRAVGASEVVLAEATGPWLQPACWPVG
jgi:hypothetical protein